MDTKYFQQALEEFLKEAVKKHSNARTLPVSELNLGQLSWVLGRAQELKEKDQHGN